MAGIRTSDPARAFAPLVRLHPKEQQLPMGARWALDRSSLWFSQGRGCGSRKIAVGRALGSQRTVAVDWLFIYGIGKGPQHYDRDWYGPTCDERQPYIFYANQLTRPHSRAGRVKGLGLTAGYYLDLMDWARRGQPLHEKRVSVPAYVERPPEEVAGKPGLRLTYWMLYGMNQPHGRRGPIARRTHEGDWERVEVLLELGDEDDEYVPIALRLHTGTAHRDVPWASVRRQHSTHPTLSASRGNHTLSATPPGDECEACLPWRTWTNLKQARRQLWYGFGGAWGEPGASTTTTGPLGPHGKWPPDSPYDP